MRDLTPSQISNWFVGQFMLIQVLLGICILGLFIGPLLTVIAGLMLFPCLISLCVNVFEEFFPEDHNEGIMGNTGP